MDQTSCQAWVLSILDAVKFGSCHVREPSILVFLKFGYCLVWVMSSLGDVKSG